MGSGYGDIVRRSTQPWIWVDGNHEFYDRKDHEGYVRVLEKRITAHGGQRFIGCTLWSDSRELHALNDLKFVKFDIICKWHQQEVAWLWNLVEHGQTRDAVIITHNAPSFRSETRLGQKFTPAFCNNMDQLVLESKAKVWIHGHTHTPCDYYIGDTRVVSNPRGYSWEPTGYERGKTIEV